jgi:hypothetical protein
MIFTHCIYSLTNGDVLCLTEGMDSQPPVDHACGGLNEPFEHWPTQPHLGAQLRYAAGALEWHDTRSDEDRDNEARAKRDRLLAETDWIVTRAIERAEAVPEVWAAYRQALRDVPEQEGFPVTIVWPEAPAP